ncbi:MAG TPA: hypothetical protein VI815_02455 [Candidatus Nanoarchaeia archaeon]|nr:hypothetical protein [Candidatus Nanoarchaeia archaeon]
MKKIKSIHALSVKNFIDYYSINRRIYYIPNHDEYLMALLKTLKRSKLLKKGKLRVIEFKLLDVPPHHCGDITLCLSDYGAMNSIVEFFKYDKFEYKKQIIKKKLTKLYPDLNHCIWAVIMFIVDRSLEDSLQSKKR